MFDNFIPILFAIFSSGARNIVINKVKCTIRGAGDFSVAYKRGEEGGKTRGRGRCAKTGTSLQIPVILVKNR